MRKIVSLSRAEDERQSEAIQRCTVCQLFKPICKFEHFIWIRRSSDYWLRCSGQVFMHTHKTIIYTPQERRKENIQHKIFFFYLFALAQILLATSHMTSEHVNRTQPRINIIFLRTKTIFFSLRAPNNMNSDNNHEMHMKEFPWKSYIHFFEYDSKSFTSSFFITKILWSWKLTEFK